MRLGNMAGVTLVGALAVSACGFGGSGEPTFSDNVTIVLNTGSSKLPYVGRFTQQGAQLAAEEINKAGGISVGGKKYGIKLEALNNDLSPTTSLDNIKKAVAEKAVAVIDDGYTVDATYQAAQAAGLPILIDYDTNAQLIDADKRPNVFRIAPPDDAIAKRYAEYLASKGMRLALVHDDSEYGKDGDQVLRDAFKTRNVSLAPNVELPSSATDYSAQALQVKQSGATGVLLWARSPVIAGFIKAYRQGGGTATIYSGPNAEDPVVRTQNADHPDYINGLTYATFRITVETGADQWEKFRHKYETRNFNDGGPDLKVGVVASDKKEVVQPPDWQIFPYDMVYLVKAALEKAGTVDTTGGKIIDALNNVQIKSANGDNRGWKKDNHEGVVDDDIYFAVFQDMVFKPVQDDPLSKSLPPIDQK